MRRFLTTQSLTMTVQRSMIGWLWRMRRLSHNSRQHSGICLQEMNITTKILPQSGFRPCFKSDTWRIQIRTDTRSQLASRLAHFRGLLPSQRQPPPRKHLPSCTATHSSIKSPYSMCSCQSHTGPKLHRQNCRTQRCSTLFIRRTLGEKFFGEMQQKVFTVTQTHCHV